MDNKTIEVCPHCGRLAWWPTFVCVHCTCELVNYRRWTKANDKEKKEILAQKMHPKEYKPMYGPGDHPEKLEEADRVDAQIRKYLAEQGSKPPEKKPTPKYVPKCPTCGSPDIEKISGTSKAVSFALFGIFSNKVKHQFKCKNCGYEW